ncbi:hypothetical protein C3L33_20474, partial [Rhododendron williamsianum]
MVSIPEIQIPLSELGSMPNTNTHSTRIPLLGYGTASWPFGESEEIMKGSFLTAIKLGYRHFDTASVYQSEQCLGEAISRALELGLIESRGELFVTSKLWLSNPQFIVCLFVREKVCLRWVYEQGASVLVKSFNEERMRENLDIFGWKLSSEESLKIDQIPQRKAYRGLEFVSDAGPFKSVEELWDGEI